MCDRFFKFFYLIGICILCICCNKNAPDKKGQFDMSLLWGKVEFVYGDTTQINNNILLVPFKGNCSLCIVDIQKYDDLFSRYLSENVKLYCNR